MVTSQNFTKKFIYSKNIDIYNIVKHNNNFCVYLKIILNKNYYLRKHDYE